ncbi:geranylgeranyl reductase family protein [Solwaraspora sp. WMMD406]|uniref:geranylgeranyl reductase family protein n=1 Tax=Solwaraspora sp. WMMD406 TaxID=3016095 RepID=UPI002417F49E|nr:geranylgeranyl reductase family protein [Solwaraspora sp. WMMD406]MDG4767361.1 geranylgeranyl reductase family protein [Solwaraspora sp. WMMD406]
MDATAFDVVVVGSGPAGATAALLAARRGWHVALVDQRAFPRDKPCGDGLGPGVAQLLRELDLGRLLAAETPVAALTVYGPGGAELNAPLIGVDGHTTEGYVVPRADFDQRLRLAALAAGAVDLAGHKVTGTGLGEQRRWLSVRRGGTESRLTAPLVVAADGAYSTVRRMLGVGRPAVRHTAIAMRAYAETDAFDPDGPYGGRMIFEWSKELLPAYGWLFPTGKGVVNVGVGVMLRAMRHRGLDLRSVLDRFADSCRQRGIELADLHAYRSHHLPLASRVPPLAHERAVLLGDAASMVNPLSGEGIVYGMTAARQLITGLPAELTSAVPLTTALNEFEAWFRRTYRAHLVSCRIAHGLMSMPWWARQVIQAAQRDPVVFSDAVSLLFGVGRIRADTTWRILRHGW